MYVYVCLYVCVCVCVYVCEIQNLQAEATANVTEGLSEDSLQINGSLLYFAASVEDTSALSLG